MLQLYILLQQHIKYDENWHAKKQFKNDYDYTTFTYVCRSVIYSQHQMNIQDMVESSTKKSTTETWLTNQIIFSDYDPPVRNKKMSTLDQVLEKDF